MWVCIEQKQSAAHKERKREVLNDLFQIVDSSSNNITDLYLSEQQLYN
jgi:hypothetical protein